MFIFTVKPTTNDETQFLPRDKKQKVTIGPKYIELDSFDTIWIP